MGRRLVCSTVLAVSCAVLAGCGASGEDGAAPTSSVERSSTSVTTTGVSDPTTPTTMAPGVDSYGLLVTTGRPWGELDLPPCDPAVDTVSPPKWLIEELPAGFQPTSTGVWRWVNSAPSPVASSWLLVDLDDQGKLLESLRLSSSPEPYDGFSPPPDSEPPVLDSVRSRPGSIGMYRTRSGPPWASAAWVESGLHWTAGGSEALGIDGLAAALDGLELSADSVADPSGRFELVGHQEQDPSFPFESGTIRLFDPRSSATVEVDVDPRPPGSWGLGTYTFETGASVQQVEGRWAARTRSGAIVAGPDGAVITVEVHGPQGDAEGLEGDQPIDPVAVGRSVVGVDPDGERAMASPSIGHSPDSDAACRRAP